MGVSLWVLAWALAWGPKRALQGEGVKEWKRGEAVLQLGRGELQAALESELQEVAPPLS